MNGWKQQRETQCAVILNSRVDAHVETVPNYLALGVVRLLHDLSELTAVQTGPLGFRHALLVVPGSLTTGCQKRFQRNAARGLVAAGAAEGDACVGLTCSGR